MSSNPSQGHPPTWHHHSASRAKGNPHYIHQQASNYWWSHCYYTFMFTDLPTLLNSLINTDAMVPGILLNLLMFNIYTSIALLPEIKTEHCWVDSQGGSVSPNPSSVSTHWLCLSKLIDKHTQTPMAPLFRKSLIHTAMEFYLYYGY